ncbi:hypothetical protein [Nocardia inohanensis]|uniref:hypothetical protein n=1 Tax=Nocardia inohanensis TaxID=209246 RepID=UPI000A91D459|nr:hypothetical protein [Nocardia inohanensis]
MTTPSARYARFSATAAAAVGAVLLMAPNAAASSWGQVTLKNSSPEVGCSYKVTSGDLVGGGSSTFNGMKVTFYDNGTAIGSGTVGSGGLSSVLTGSPATVSWTPKTTGQHVLTATSEYLGGTPGNDLTPLTVQVTAASATGSFGCSLSSFSG